MREFANWLSTADLSIWIATNLWVIPTIQSIHILAIGVITGSVLMLDLRLLRAANHDQTLVETTKRYSPWLWGSLAVLFVTGLLMIIGEPARELLSLSFWLKMVLIVIGAGFIAAFQASLKRNHVRWERELVTLPSTKAWAVVTLLIWAAIIVLGRFIAWDAQIWGTWSPHTSG
jgi:hypothetical protein